MSLQAWIGAMSSCYRVSGYLEQDAVEIFLIEIIG